jgi:hypothetical protein
MHNIVINYLRKTRMSNWHEPLIFTLALLAFVLGMSSMIMGFLPQPAGKDALKARVEYGFFGVSGLVLFVLFVYAMSNS